MDTTRWTAIAVGGGFLAAMVTYGGGSGLVEPPLAAEDTLLEVADAETRFAAGALLMLVNSAVVVGIGVLLLPILRRHSPTTAYAYLSARIVEAVLLATGVVFLLLLVPLADAHAAGGGADAATLEALAEVAIRGNDLGYQVGMLALGVGSLPFCSLLYRTRLVPPLLAAWGFLGYVVLAAGAALELLGVAVGVVTFVPGGLFELAFGVWLVGKGFDEAAMDAAEAGARELD